VVQNSDLELLTRSPGVAFDSVDIPFEALDRLERGGDTSGHKLLAETYDIWLEGCCGLWTAQHSVQCGLAPGRTVVSKYSLKFFGLSVSTYEQNDRRLVIIDML
jgi:hypothetical protein